MSRAQRRPAYETMATAAAASKHSGVDSVIYATGYQAGFLAARKLAIAAARAAADNYHTVAEFPWSSEEAIDVAAAAIARIGEEEAK